MFMHTPERQAAWFKTTGAFPADDRFNTKLITLPQQKVLFDLVKNGSPYLENFIPTELDAKAYFAQSQLVLGGKHHGSQGGRGDREGGAADPHDAAKADGELQDVVSLVPLGTRATGVGGRVTPDTVALARPRRRRRFRPGRFEPLLWIAPAVAVVAVRVRLLDGRARQVLVPVRRRLDDRELPHHVDRPDLPHGARPQRPASARGPDPRRARRCSRRSCCSRGCGAGGSTAGRSSCPTCSRSR